MSEKIQLCSKTLRTDSGMVAVRCELYENGVLQTQTTMSLDDYISLLQGATRRKMGAQKISLGNVPPGLVDGYVSGTKGTVGGVFYIPPQKHQFVLDKTSERDRKSYYLPMPGLVYLIAYEEGVRKMFYCFAYNGQWNGADTLLCRYPFGNVSSTGSVCIGSASVNRQIANLYDLREVIEDSLDGVTNGHYCGGKVVLSCDMTQHDFADMIADAEEFPSHLLISGECECGRTVGDLVHMLKQYMGAF